MDRRPSVGAVPLINGPRHALDLLIQAIVGLDVGSAWHCDLHKGKPLAQIGVAFPQEVERLQFLLEAFRIIDTIDTDAQHLAIRSKPFANPVDASFGIRALRRRAVFVDVDRNRQRTHPARSAVDNYTAPVEINFDLELLLYRAQKVSHKRWQMESNQVIAEQSTDDVGAA